MIRKRNNKRALYESIMKDVSKTVKRRLNENNNDKIIYPYLENMTKDMLYISPNNRGNKDFISVTVYVDLRKLNINPRKFINTGYLVPIDVIYDIDYINDDNTIIDFNIYDNNEFSQDILDAVYEYMDDENLLADVCTKIDEILGIE